MEVVKRPSANDTEEDLLRMQEELLKNKGKKEKNRSVAQHAKDRNSFAKKSKQVNRQTGRFCLDLDALAEEGVGTLKLIVEERNVEFLCNLDQLSDNTSLKCGYYAKEDGFPDILDLSRYYADGDGSVNVLSEDGRSLFAVEFDKLHGRITDYEHAEASASSATPESVTNSIDEEIERENLQRIGRMSKLEIEKAREEIIERFDATLLDFLRKRAKRKTQQQQRKAKEIEPMPQQTIKSTDAVNGTAARYSVGSNHEMSDQIQQLEIFDVEKDKLVTHKNLKATALDHPYLRLATDAAQLDMATKCLRTMVPRQQQCLVRLFDNLQIPPRDYAGGDDLLEKARTNLNAIKGLYLERRKDKSGNMSIQFAEGINPFGSAAWMLSPIRKVLDVVQKDGKTTAQDLVVVRLSLFWTLLVMVERPTLFYAFATPNEVFVRIAEIFLMGPEIFNDDCVSQCISRFLHVYLVPRALDGQLCLALEEPVGGLDAFEPFYEDLLQHFEEFSVTDVNFTSFILLGAYANQRLLDGLLMKCAVWAPNRNIVRQMTINKDSGAFLLDFLADKRMITNDIEKKHFTQYGQLLGMYAAAIRNNSITKDRNPLVYEIASRELGCFLQRHTAGKKAENTDTETVKQCDALVCILRRSLSGYLDL